MIHNRLNFLLSSRQFKKQLQINRQDLENWLENEPETINNFQEIDQDNDRYAIENSLISYLNKNDGLALLTFQTFLRSICYRLDISCIDLKRLRETCNNKEQQMVLLLGIHFYFVN